MNNKELISELSAKLDMSQKNAGELLKSFVELVSEHIIGGNHVTFLDLGTFEQQYREQRISVNPITKKRLLVPQKKVVDFRTANTLKNHLKTLENYE